MAEPEQQTEPVFGRQEPEREVPWLAIGIGAAAIAIVVVLVILLSKPAPQPTRAPADPYAAKVVLTGLHMSVAENFAGAEVTYIEGQVENTGDKAVTGATVEMRFKNTLGEVAQKEDLPLMVVTTREPYIDQALLSETLPLKPGQKRDFRLALEHVSADWDRALPETQVVGVQTR